MPLTARLASFFDVRSGDVFNINRIFAYEEDVDKVFNRETFTLAVTAPPQTIPTTCDVTTIKIMFIEVLRAAVSDPYPPLTVRLNGTIDIPVNGFMALRTDNVISVEIINPNTTTVNVRMTFAGS